MSGMRTTDTCPMCGDVLAIENFQFADVWKDNRKQRLFVCRHCANKASRKRVWRHQLDEFDSIKGRR